MKRIIYLIVVTLFLMSCDKKITTLQYEGMKGKVKSTFTYCYEAESRFGNIEKGNIIYSYDFPYWSNIIPASKVEFNEEGNIIKKTTFSTKGETAVVEIHEYENGRISSICGYGYDGEVAYLHNYHYQNGKLIGYESTSPYDKAHNITRRYGIEDDKIVLDSVFVGNKLRSIIHIQEDLSIEIDTYGKEIWRFINESDDCGRPLRLESKHQEGDNFIDYTRLFEYNENGWIISAREEKNGDIEEIIYEYISIDSKGNWISRTIYLDKELKAIEERTIEYY